MIASRRYAPLFGVLVGLAGLVGLSAAARAQVPASPAAPPAPSLAVTPAPPPAASPGIPLRASLQLEAANGVVTGGFHNQLLGARLDGGFSEHLSLGGYLGVADLKGKDGRAHAALTYAILEYRAGPPEARVRYPLSFASGYLTANGPVARVAGGLAVRLGTRVELVGELASMVWLTNNQNLLSLDGSLAVAFRL